ncbi:hypothetical protein A6V36_24340 [Paraburkholderia ginsengiterrae]|uniref:Uncharacterized protein n=1 Tax=Paraburkholderia ginsengiterrae TaxID=1462993 RepID=A0A1A9NBK0_9BURK|nr:hypothetical protein [Paraburkholderia ginsengiterrae]OAJ61503.1 hypothetical protein A6V36_24340 [Paraburkholderia ginsengiterrae]OAJ62905.1 hypothetical protein A6V37_22115 [Paraburkholderia ginsengiterrae]
MLDTLRDQARYPGADGAVHAPAETGKVRGGRVIVQRRLNLLRCGGQADGAIGRIRLSFGLARPVPVTMRTSAIEVSARPVGRSLK